jgi:hypothetical protein
LYDPNIEIQTSALDILVDLCRVEGTKSAVIESNPSLDHLGSIGNPLCFELLSQPSGFEFLLSSGYIAKEYSNWIKVCTSLNFELIYNAEKIVDAHKVWNRKLCG